MAEPTLLHLAVSYLGSGYLHLVGRTSRVQKLDHPAALRLRREKRPAIYAFWHNTQVFLAYDHRGENVHIMVSQSKDGEYIAQVMKRLGLNAIRGSSSFGGRKALRDVIAILKDGGQAGFTPDGPKGPVYSVSSGVIGAAQLAGVPIIPTTVRCSRKIVFKSWDRFVLPLPFSHVVVGHGQPIWIKREDDHDRAKAQLKAALHKIEEETELSLSVAPSLASSAVGFLLYALYLALSMLMLPFVVPFVFLRYGLKRSLLHFRERLGFGQIRASAQQRIWFHAASLGEWQALRPLIKKFQTLNEVGTFVTCSTPEAKRIISLQEPSLEVSLLPLDLPFLMPRFIKRLNPSALILIESELWPHMIQTCSLRNIPILVANGRFSRKSLKVWKMAGALAARFMTQINWFFVRTDSDGRNFCRLRVSPLRVTVTGNVKVDGLKVLSWEEKTKRRGDFFRHPEGVYVVAGSTWPTEEEAILSIFNRPMDKKIRLMLAPRRPERFADVERILQSHPLTWSKWSMVKNIGEWTTDVLLVDTLGDLKDLYGVCDIAFIGGTLVPRGGQNPLEPAAARVPILFGPYMENFSEEAAEFKRKGAARQVRHKDDLMFDLSEMILDEGLRRSMAEAGANVVLSKQGAVERTFAGLRSALGV